MRARRIMLGCCIAACVLIVGLAVASMFLTFMVTVGDWMIGTTAGNIMPRYLPASDLTAYFEGVEVWRRDNVAFHFALPDVTRFPGGAIHVTIPLWFPLSFLPLPTLLLWRRVRRPLSGHCQQCGYDVRANRSGVCSECGERIPTAVPTASG